MSEKFTPEAEPIQSREERIKKLREKFSQFSRELDQALDSKKENFLAPAFINLITISLKVPTK